MIIKFTMKTDSTKSAITQNDGKSGILNRQNSLVDAASQQNLSLESSFAKKDFASILKSTSVNEDTKQTERKSKESEDNKKTGKPTDESKSVSDNKESLRKNNSEDSQESDKDSNFENNKGIGNLLLFSQSNTNEINIPSARAILHIADLERIISSIRSQNAVNGKQITISLKQSVLQGLELKLFIGKDKSVSAEFIAANENIKSQLNAKADELAGILRDRGIKLTSLKMSLSSDSNDQNKQKFNDQIKIDTENAKLNNLEQITEEANLLNEYQDSDTSYQI